MTAYSGPEAAGPGRSKASGRTCRIAKSAMREGSRAGLMGEVCLADEFILETHGLTKEFAGFFAVRDVALRSAVAAFTR